MFSSPQRTIPGLIKPDHRVSAALEFAAASTHRLLWARAYYDRQRQRAASHHAAVRALGYEWVRILYRCWQTRTPYDEPLYLEALRWRRSPLWLAAAISPTQHTRS